MMQIYEKTTCRHCQGQTGLTYQRPLKMSAQLEHRAAGPLWMDAHIVHCPMPEAPFSSDSLGLEPSTG